MSNQAQVPFVDLSRQFKNIESELTDVFLRVGRSGMYVMGEYLESFEKKIADYIGVKYAIGVGNGSDALFLILKALGIGAGDEVITVPNSFIATTWTIIATGAQPIFIDVDQDMNMNPVLIENVISSHTKAIMPVHLTGRPASMNKINEIALKYNLFVIEDAAQAIGALYHGKRVGSLSHAAGFSLHPLKNLSIYGDGGLITTSDEYLFEKLKKLRNHGLMNRDECEMWGFNSRLDSLQAAFAEVKLKYIDTWNIRCRSIAKIYRKELSKYVEVPIDKEWEKAVYHNFVIRTDKRDELIEYLKGQGVDTRIHYPIPIHLQKAAHTLGYKDGDFPNTEKYAKTMVSLPIFPELSDEEIYRVVQSIVSFFNS